MIIFSKKNDWEKWHCLTFLQISLMAGLLEDSWIRRRLLGSVYCDTPCHIRQTRSAYASKRRTVEKPSRLLALLRKEFWPRKPPRRGPTAVVAVSVPFSSGFALSLAPLVRDRAAELGSDSLSANISRNSHSPKRKANPEGTGYSRAPASSAS